jgi:hypothetical protein
MGKSTKEAANLQPVTMSARNADMVLDHLSIVIREASRNKGRVEPIQGLNLQYWIDRITTVIHETVPFSSQQERAKRLLIQLESSKHG